MEIPQQSRTRAEPRIGLPHRQPQWPLFDLPVYGREKYIGTAIESLLAQRELPAPVGFQRKGSRRLVPAVRALEPRHGRGLRRDTHERAPQNAAPRELRLVRHGAFRRAGALGFVHRGALRREHPERAMVANKDPKALAAWNDPRRAGKRV